jgi:hypothetical protein
MTPVLEHLPLQEAERWLRNGDVALYHLVKQASPVSSKIAGVGRSLYTHAGMLKGWDGRWMVQQFRELRGSGAVTLRHEVTAYPGAIHIYRPTISDQEADDAADAFCRMLGQPYNYRGILGAWLLRVPGLRKRFPVDTRDGRETTAGAKYCSQAVACALRIGARRDPVPNLADRYTEPGDLARSTLLRPLFVLVP